MRGVGNPFSMPSSLSWSFAVCWVALAISSKDDSNCSQPSSDVEVSLLALSKGRLARARQTQETLALASQNQQASAEYLKNATSSPWVARSITDIFQETRTDKEWLHGYNRYYDEKLRPFREQAGVRILEIGADSGISLGAWLTYFKDPAEVAGIAYGVDAEHAHNKSCEIMPDQCDRLKIISMDQSNKAALSDLKQHEPKGWDIIIDDGSHKPEHQLISFQFLWEKVRPGGMYVVEDVETSYVDNGKSIYGYELHGGIGASPPNNAVEKFKQLVDVVSRKHFSQEQFTVFGGVDKDVAGVYFGDGIIFVHKQPSDPEWNSYPSGNFVQKADTYNTFETYQAKLSTEADLGARRSGRDLLQKTNLRMTTNGKYCSSGEDITTASECQSAAAELGIPFQFSYYGPNDHKYCLMANDGRKKMYFNTADVTEAAPHPPKAKYASICKLAKV